MVPGNPGRNMNGKLNVLKRRTLLQETTKKSLGICFGYLVEQLFNPNTLSNKMVCWNEADIEESDTLPAT